MDSDLEILIRDRATIISPANGKSHMQIVLIIRCTRNHM